MPRKKSLSNNYKRADRPEQKDERRQLILRAAAAELALGPSVHDFTVNSLAKRTGLAKGTIYLYFKGKNAILLELLGDAIEKLAIEIGTRIARLPDPVSSKQVARIIGDSLMKSSASRRLAQLLKSLSGGDSLCSHDKFYKRIDPHMKQADAIIVGRLHGFDLGEGRQIIRYGWALLLGLTQMAEYHTKPKHFPLNVGESLREGLTLLIEGGLARRR